MFWSSLLLHISEYQVSWLVRTVLPSSIQRTKPEVQPTPATNFTAILVLELVVTECISSAGICGARLIPRGYIYRTSISPSLYFNCLIQHFLAGGRLHSSSLSGSGRNPSLIDARSTGGLCGERQAYLLLWHCAHKVIKIGGRASDLGLGLWCCSYFPNRAVLFWLVKIFTWGCSYPVPISQGFSNLFCGELPLRPC